MKEQDEELKEWCKSVSVLAVDVLVDAELVKKDDFSLAVDIVTEEILVRLIMGDYPPPSNKKLIPENSQK